MKQVKFFTALLLTGAMFTSCGDEKKDEPTPEPEVVTSESYQGTMIVNLTDGSTYTQENVTVDYNITDTAGLVLSFYQVSFSPKMPVKIDMDIPNVSYTIDDEGNISLSGDEIIPWAMGGEFPNYTITGLSGTINDGTISVSMTCGQSPLTFNGTKGETSLPTDDEGTADDDNNESGNQPETEEVTSMSFLGTLNVEQSDETTYTQEEVTIEYAMTDTAGLVITLQQVSFSSRMPMKLDLIIPNVGNETQDGKTTLSGNEIIPIAMGKEYPNYTITDLTGTIEDANITLSMTCGSSPMTFSGSRQ